MPTARIIRRRLTELGSLDEETCIAAALDLIDRGGWRLRRRLEVVESCHPSAQARASAAYALGFRGDTRAAPALARTLADSTEDPDVRCHAAEALGHLLQCSAPRRPGVDAVVESAVLAGLDDPSPEVRFWSIFAAAQVPVPAAQPRLRALAAEDRSQVEAMWGVATEAEWALRCLAGDPKADEALPQLS